MRLTIKVILILLGLLVVLMSVTGFISIHREKQVIQQLHKSHGQTTANTIAASCIEAMMSADYPVVDTFINTIGKENKDILLIEVRRNNKVVSQYRDRIPDHTYAVFWGKIHFSAELSDEILDLGEVRVHVSDQLNKELIGSRIRELVYFTILMFVVTFSGTAIILRKTVLEKIQLLSNHAKKIGEGDLKTKLSFNSNDELRDLALAINEMSKNIFSTQKEIEKQNIDLKNKTIMLKKASIEAQAANRTKSEFLANISHEVRTPLNAIHGDVDYLMSSTNDTKQKKKLESIQKASTHLLSMFNDILDISKMDTGQIELVYSSINISTIIHEVLSIFEKQCMNKGLQTRIEIDPELPVGLSLDEKRLRQILINLIGNAVKFTDQGQLQIKTGFLSPVENSVCDFFISIEDTGIGISPAQQKHVFKLFQQENGSKSREFGGVGVGLTITQKLAESMNGKLSINSDLGIGTSVQVSFFNAALSNPDVVNFESQESIDPPMDKTKLEIQSFVNSFSIKSIHNLHALITALDKNFKPKLVSLEEPFDMDDVIDFANQLKQLGKEFDACMIIEYADLFYQAAGEFDILEIQKLMKLFNPILSQLKLTFRSL